MTLVAIFLGRKGGEKNKVINYKVPIKFKNGRCQRKQSIKGRTGRDSELYLFLLTIMMASSRLSACLLHDKKELYHQLLTCTVIEKWEREREREDSNTCIQRRRGPKISSCSTQDTVLSTTLQYLWFNSSSTENHN